MSSASVSAKFAPELSVVVLCYHSAASVPGFVSELTASLERSGVDWEAILVANDFADSDDLTSGVVRGLARSDPRLHAVIRVKRGMMGWDMRSGLEAARGRAVAVIDGDGQMPPGDVLRVYEHIRRDGLDLVKTVRQRRDDGLYRRVISRVYNLAFRVLFPGLGCRDVNSKPKVMTREALERMTLSDDGWFIDAELMIEARRLGLRVGEVPTVFHSLQDRPSFVRPGAVLEFAASLLRHRLRGSRHRSAGGLGDRSLDR